MKTCPICNAVAFDDALVCYGCMHRYDEPEETGAEGAAGDLDAHAVSINAQREAERSPDAISAPAFCIRMVPCDTPGGGVAWACSVELEDARA